MPKREILDGDNRLFVGAVTVFEFRRHTEPTQLGSATTVAISTTRQSMTIALRWGRANFPKRHRSGDNGGAESQNRVRKRV